MQGLLFIDWIAILFMIILTLISFGFFGFFTSKYKSSADKTKIQLAFLVFFLCMGIARIILIYFDYFLTNLDLIEYSNHQFFWKLASVFQLTGIGGIIYTSESGVFKGKDYYVFLIGFSVFTLVAMVHPVFIMAQTFTLIAISFAIFVPISFIYLAYKLPPSRKNIAYLFIGFSIFGIGVLMVFSGVTEMFPNLLHELYLISTAIQIPGFVIFALGVKQMYFAE